MMNFAGKFSFVLWAALILPLINANCDTECVANAFIEFEIVPDVLPHPPPSLLKVTFNNNLVVNKGNELTPRQVKDQPKVEYDADSSSFYTLVMLDPDVPSRALAIFREFKHWIIGNIPANKIKEGQVITAFQPSAPPIATGLHRYIFLLYKQPGKVNFNEIFIPSNIQAGRMNFKVVEFAKKYNLGCPIAGNFYQAQYDSSVPILSLLDVD